jgi:hypothetical protein
MSYLMYITLSARHREVQRRGESLYTDRSFSHSDVSGIQDWVAPTASPPSLSPTPSLSPSPSPTSSPGVYDSDIDLVYTWVNGSDPFFYESLSAFREPGSREGDASAAQMRFRDRGELRYTVRSAFMHMNWFRKVFIVTNGDIPSWLDVRHPRVELVPHSSIFTNHSHLPTFSSTAIETHLHRIPGLSPWFVYSNDDMLLDRDFLLSDLIKPTGQYVVYDNFGFQPCNQGSKQAECLRPPGTGFEDQLRFTNRLFNEVFRFRVRRNGIDHLPFLVETTKMQELQDIFSEEYDTTSSHRFREHNDIQTAFAYHHYLIETGEPYFKGSSHTSSLIRVDDTLQYRLNGFLKGAIRKKPKVVTLNDDITDDFKSTDLMLLQLNEFMEAHWPVRSPIELPFGMNNNCSRMPFTRFGQRIGVAELDSICPGSNTLIQKDV